MDSKQNELTKETRHSMLQQKLSGKNYYLISGSSGDGIPTGEGDGSCDCRRSQETASVSVGSWAKKAISIPVTDKEVQYKQEKESWRDCGVLHPNIFMPDHCGEEEKQESRRIFDHYKKSQEFLAFGLNLYVIISSFSCHCCFCREKQDGNGEASDTASLI